MFWNEFPKFMNHVMIDGFVSYITKNVGILVFLVILGMLVAMMNLSGLVLCWKLGSSGQRRSPWRTVLDRYSQEFSFRRLTTSTV